MMLASMSRRGCRHRMGLCVTPNRGVYRLEKVAERLCAHHGRLLVGVPYRLKKVAERLLACCETSLADPYARDRDNPLPHKLCFWKTNPGGSRFGTFPLPGGEGGDGLKYCGPLDMRTLSRELVVVYAAL